MNQGGLCGLRSKPLHLRMVRQQDHPLKGNREKWEAWESAKNGVPVHFPGAGICSDRTGKLGSTSTPDVGSRIAVALTLPANLAQVDRNVNLNCGAWPSLLYGLAGSAPSVTAHLRHMDSLGFVTSLGHSFSRRSRTGSCHDWPRPKRLQVAPLHSEQS